MIANSALWAALNCEETMKRRSARGEIASVGEGAPPSHRFFVVSSSVSS
jgi:hypothetical protein